MRDGEGAGRYKIRTPLSGKDLAYVTDLLTSTFVDESEYHARGYQPAFEDLPRKEDYNLEMDAKRVANGCSNHKP